MKDWCEHCQTETPYDDHGNCICCGKHIHENKVIENIRKILNNEDLCAEAMVSEIGELVGTED